ncbi:copper resistance protein B [Novosphingobium terrae]|uniref:copper resistance protein B n=1 Tax=Novosphingobium terrae TaxID=2726189 RepID=UPI001981FBA4|nr:copper resistance protein B [Novosphingobium terrae]
MRRLAFIALTLACASPAFAQDHAHDAPPAADAADPVGTDQPAGSASAPSMAHNRAADRYYDPVAMARAEAAMMREGGGPYGAAVLDLAEYRLNRGRDSYEWEGEGWVGDLNRFVLRSRGEGEVGQKLDHGEVEAAYSRALTPWWNVQAGVRQDFGQGPARTHAMVALEGLAPYRFDVLAQAYLSDRGEVSARLEVSADQRITRKLVLQPRGEVLLAAQDLPGQRLGAGLSSAEAGLRLRYEFTRKFAPYVGVNWEWLPGRSGDLARLRGDSANSRGLVLGLHGWF